jgi:hypothetical protein
MTLLCRRILVVALIVMSATAVLAAEQTVYVAVGYGGRRMSSTDGRSWQNVQQWADKGADDSNNLMGLAYGKGKWVCVGGGGWSKDSQAGHILVSTDGTQWREVAKYAFRVNPVVFDGTRFIAGGPTHQLLWSDDGEKWNEGPKATLPAGIPGWAFWFRKGATGNGTSVFMGNAGPKQTVWWCLASKGGTSIDALTTDLPKCEALCFGAGRFLAATSDKVLSSTDGAKWEPVGGVPDDQFRDLLWTGSRFFLIGKKSSYVSADGLTWKPFGKAPPCRVAFSDDKIWIGTNWPGQMLYSADGLKWEKAGQPMPAMGVNKIVAGFTK